jgi:hypothetical protein
VQNPNEPMLKGIYLTLALFFLSIVQTIVFQQYFNRMFSLGACIKTAVISLIYKKVKD